MYKNYIFDLYGTLVDINTDEENLIVWENVSNLLKKYNINYYANELKDNYNQTCKYLEDTLSNNNKYYEINIADVFKIIAKKKDINLSNSDINTICINFRKITTKYIRLYDGVMDLLETLKHKNKKIYLLSNAQEIITNYEIDMLNIRNYFDGIVLSSSIKVKKPSSEIFDFIFKKYNLKKNESIMIGNDKLCDIKGAKKFNIDSLYIHSNISNIDDLKSKTSAKYEILDGNVNKIKEMIVK